MITREFFELHLLVVIHTSNEWLAPYFNSADGGQHLSDLHFVLSNKCHNSSMHTLHEIEDLELLD
jgi:hypothetical protein